jgi:hypothetical protein
VIENNSLYHYVFGGAEVLQYWDGDAGISTGVDVTHTFGSMESNTFHAGFDTVTNHLIVKSYRSAYGGDAWQAPVVIPAPSGMTFAYSPTICARTGDAGGNTSGGVHAAAVASGHVWYADLGTRPVEGDTFVWEVMSSEVAPGSSPDFVVTGSGSTLEVNAVLLNAASEAVLIRGTTGDFTVTNLGL